MSHTSYKQIGWLAVIAIGLTTANIVNDLQTAQVNTDGVDEIISPQRQVILLPANVDNFVECQQTVNQPVTVDDHLNDNATVWVYEFNNEEPPYTGDYFFSRKKLAQEPQLREFNTLNQLRPNRRYYVKAEVNVLFDCLTGIVSETAPPEPGAECGNGLIEDNEECDDENDVSKDGCTSCAIDTGYTCRGEPSTCQVLIPDPTEQTNPVDEPQPTESHTACQNDSCVVVDGSGPDECGTDADCVSVPDPTHTECRDNMCQVVQGAGQNECATDTDCAPAETHTVCQNQACTVVQGAGDDQCTTDSDCAQPKPTHTVCQNNACVSVDGAGSDECSSDQDCAGECTDSDGGKEPDALGTVKYRPPAGTQVFEESDMCSGENLIEWYCNEKGLPASEAIECNCIDGKCADASSITFVPVLLDEDLFSGIKQQIITAEGTIGGYDPSQTVSIEINVFGQANRNAGSAMRFTERLTNDDVDANGHWQYDITPSSLLFSDIPRQQRFTHGRMSVSVTQNQTVVAQDSFTFSPRVESTRGERVHMDDGRFANRYTARLYDVDYQGALHQSPRIVYPGKYRSGSNQLNNEPASQMATMTLVVDGVAESWSVEEGDTFDTVTIYTRRFAKPVFDLRPSTSGKGPCVSLYFPGDTAWSSACNHIQEACGNHLKEWNEQCDYTDQADLDVRQILCSADCKVTKCGNHEPDRGEFCDDGNQIDDALCSADCSRGSTPECGDGAVQSSNNEECDDGNDNPNDTCNNECRLTSNWWIDRLNVAGPVTQPEPRCFMFDETEDVVELPNGNAGIAWIDGRYSSGRCWYQHRVHHYTPGTGWQELETKTIAGQTKDTSMLLPTSDGYAVIWQHRLAGANCTGRQVMGCSKTYIGISNQQGEWQSRELYNDSMKFFDQEVFSNGDRLLVFVAYGKTRWHAPQTSHENARLVVVRNVNGQWSALQLGSQPPGSPQMHDVQLKHNGNRNFTVRWNNKNYPASL